MARTRRANACLTAAAVLAFASTGVATAAEVGVDVSAGVGYSDNVGLTDADEDTATIGSIGLRVDAAKDTRRLESLLSTDLELVDYFGSDYSSEVTGNAAARARFALVESRLHWTFEDSFGQTRIDPFSFSSPENRENVNFFATGPDLLLPLDRVMDLRLAARYSRVDYQDSPADSERFGGSLALERELSSAARVSLNGAYQKIEPKDELLTASFEHTSAYLRYALAGARSSIAVDAGANQVKGDDVDSTGAVLRLELTRRVGAFSRLSVRLGNELTDSGAGLGDRIDAPVPGGAPSGDALLQQATPYTSRYVDLGWNVTGRRTSIDLSAGWFDEDYETAGALDRQRQAFGARASRTLGPRASVSAGVLFDRYTSDVPAATDNDELSYNLAFNWRLGPRLSTELAGERSEFSSDAVGGKVAEMRYWLRLHYGRDLSR